MARYVEVIEECEGCGDRRRVLVDVADPGGAAFVSPHAAAHDDSGKALGAYAELGHEWPRHEEGKRVGHHGQCAQRRSPSSSPGGPGGPPWGGDKPHT